MEERERKNRPVLIDPAELEEIKGAPLTDDEICAVAIAADSMACGRTHTQTVANIERTGGEVSKGVKRLLGLEPPARLIIPGPPESIGNN